MANTITTNTVTRGSKQFQGAFKEMWLVKATISDTDAIALNDTLALTMTATGVALGDMCIGGSLTLDLSDGTDQAVATFHVTAANTVTLYLQADLGEFAADALNGAVVKVLVGRPTW